ncbi:MAG: transposase [Prevotella sp.]|nr:transposase [Prevotella sp.]
MSNFALYNVNEQSMPRQKREKSGTGIYHVMLRGINRQDIFEDDEDYLRMLDLLRLQTNRSESQGDRPSAFCRIYAFCLMSNHVHLLIGEESASVGDVVKRIGVAYASYFNRKYGRNGHLFQDRFKSEAVNSLEYFVTLLRYIHQNPVKAGLVSNVADYNWSSWQDFDHAGVNAPSICHTASVLNRIPISNLRELVNTPIDDQLGILDIDTDTQPSVSDNDIKSFLFERSGMANPLDIQTLPKEQRNELLQALKEFGGGVRQLSRITGVSYGIIQRI